MSNSKKAVQEIKNLMKQFGFISDEVTLLSFKLEDNTILQAEKLEVGKKIVKINDTFEQVALEDGSYRLVENFNLEVKEGLIVSVREIFVDAKLVDGTVLKIDGDAIAEGAKVVVVTPDAEIPAPDGTHELEGGDKIETKDGVIVTYTEVGPEPADGMPENGAPEAPSIDAPMKMDEEMMSMIKDFVTKMGEKVSKMEQNYNSLQNEFNSFKKQPAAKKIADGKVESFKSNNNDDVLSARIASLKSLQNK
jgi:hypothetical protein